MQRGREGTRLSFALEHETDRLRRGASFLLLIRNFSLNGVSSTPFPCILRKVAGYISLMSFLFGIKGGVASES